MGLIPTKKGIHGISILFFFLAVLLISVSIAAVILTNTDKLVGAASKQYDRVEGTFKAVNVIEVAGEDARDELLESLLIDISLLDHSEPLHLDDISLSIGDENSKTNLNWREDGDIVNNNTGYNTWSPEEMGQVNYSNSTLDADLDDDMLNDYVTLNATHALFTLSSTPSTPIAVSLDADISAPTTININKRLTLDGVSYGWLRVNGTTLAADVIDAAVECTVTPYKDGSGYFVIEYLRRGTAPQDGFIVPGDLVRFHVDTYQPIGVDQIVAIQFLYHNMETVSKLVYTYNTIPYAERYVIYPRP